MPATATLVWLSFALSAAALDPTTVPSAPKTHFEVRQDSTTGQVTITEAGRTVLRYNYGTVEPGTLLDRVHADNRKYARARSDYIHPLFGLEGEELTTDWPIDHPHHRGIYWAWPEVMFRGETGDLHALQRVFARPTGRCQVRSSDLFAEIDADNVWLWEDRDPLVKERVVIRVFRSGTHGRWVDLELHFVPIQEGISLARRGTDKYGGLNIRFAAVKDQQISPHLAPAQTEPRTAWADISGLFPGQAIPSGVTILQSPTNLRYPGDWVQFPELNWLQPTFPSAGERYALNAPLVLRFRLWVHPGRTPTAEACAEQWKVYRDEAAPRPQP